MYVRITEAARRLDEQAAPLKQVAREQYASLRGLIDRFEADHEAIKLDQQELELRYKLGEFDEKEFQKRIKAIEASVKDKAEARARGLEMKARFLEAFHAESDLESAASPRPVRSPADSQVPQTMKAPKRARPTCPAFVRTSRRTRRRSCPPLTSPVCAPRCRPRPQRRRPVAAPRRFSARRASCRKIPKPANGYTLTLKPMAIGADPSSDIRIAGPGVEPKHAQINVSMVGFTLVDLGTKHGTRVNAEKIRERQLANEDVIQIGAARFVFREG